MVVLICVPLTIRHIGHLFMWFLATCMQHTRLLSLPLAPGASSDACVDALMQMSQ